MKAVVCHSEDIDSLGAIEDIVDDALAQFADTIPQVGILCAGIDHEFQTILDRIYRTWPDLKLIGSTTDGEVSSCIGFAEDSVVLMLLHSDRVQFGVGLGENLKADPVGATRSAVESAMQGLTEEIRLCIVTPDGLGAYTPDILSTASEMLGADVPICGGLSGDQSRREQTFQFFGSSVYTDAVPLLLFAGPLAVGTGVDSGFEPLGSVLTVTRAEGNVIYSIDDYTPRDFWLHYFGTDSFAEAHHWLAVYPDRPSQRRDEEYGDFYITTPVHFNEDGSLQVLNPVQTGASLRLTNASRDQMIEGTRASIAKGVSAFGESQADAVLVFSCAGRRLRLGTRVGEEWDALRGQFGEDLPLAGFYTYGEICPLPESGIQQAHGCTFVTVLVGEV